MKRNVSSELGERLFSKRYNQPFQVEYETWQHLATSSWSMIGQLIGTSSKRPCSRFMDCSGFEEDDDQISVERVRALETEKFKAADVDHDDVLNLEEMASLFYMETSPPVLDVVVRDTLKTKDKNKDGVLSAKEFWDFAPGEKIRDEEMKEFRKLDKDFQMVGIEFHRVWDGVELSWPHLRSCT